MNDFLISRSAFLDALILDADNKTDLIQVHQALEKAVISPDDVRDAGEWIDKPTGRYGQWQSWCSACGNKSGIGGIKSNRHKPYCPNCGARMKGAEDETTDNT